MFLPRSRAASPGCGVITVFPSGLFISMLCHSLSDMIFSASASSTSGPLKAVSSSSIEAHASGLFPSPGPMAIASYLPRSVLEKSRSMHVASGTAVCNIGNNSAGTAACTRPLPALNAPETASTAAPAIPLEPAAMRIRPQ